METKGILLTLCIVLLGILVSSCKKSNEPTSPTTQVNLRMEIISFQDAQTVGDSTLCYIQDFVSWNASSLLDTIKADSLAQWFAQSPYQITDMWFPNVYTRCMRPIMTENEVTLKLSSQDTNLRSLGYRPTANVVSGCFPYYRHYIFTRISDGT